MSYGSFSSGVLYAELVQVDKLRASEIHPNDRYRIIRALQIAKGGGIPSALKPRFAPFFDRSLIIKLDRKDDDLRQRITNRIAEMIRLGWVQEVKGLSDEWREFALERKLIGYRQIAEFSCGARTDDFSVEIANETWGYVKRQRKYLRSLQRKLESIDNSAIDWREFCLTSKNCEVYLNQIKLLYAS